MVKSRYRKADAQAAFGRLALAYGLSAGTEYVRNESGEFVANVGAYALSYEGRRFKIVRMMEHGGESEPFGARTYSAGEFVGMCGFAIDALHESAIRDQRDLLMIERNAVLVTLRDLHAALNPTLGGQAVSLDERGLRRLLDASNKAADVLALFRETLDRLSPRSGPESAVEAQEGR